MKTSSNSFIEFQKELKNLLAKDMSKFFVVIDRFLKNDSEFTNTYVQQKGRYNATLSNYQLNEIKVEERTREFDKIRASLIQYLNEIEESDFDVKYKDWLIKQYKKKEFKEIEVISKSYEEIKINTKRIGTGLAILFFIGLLSFVLWTNYKINRSFGKDEPLNYTSKGVYSYKEEKKQFEKEPGFKQVVIEFWTPNYETKFHVSTMNGLSDTLMKQNYKRYYIKDSLETENNIFIDEIRDEFSISGFSRYKVWGSGSKGMKPGWLWIVNINNDENTYSRDTFLQLYSDFWDRNRGIYLVETYLRDKAID